MDQNQNTSQLPTAESSMLDSIFASVEGDTDSPYSQEIQRAIALARHLQRRANELQTPQERRQQSELDRMIQNPGDKVTMTR